MPEQKPAQSFSDVKRYKINNKFEVEEKLANYLKIKL